MSLPYKKFSKYFIESSQRTSIQLRLYHLNQVMQPNWLFIEIRAISLTPPTRIQSLSFLTSWLVYHFAVPLCKYTLLFWLTFYQHLSKGYIRCWAWNSSAPACFKKRQIHFFIHLTWIYTKIEELREVYRCWFNVCQNSNVYLHKGTAK